MSHNYKSFKTKARKYHVSKSVQYLTTGTAYIFEKFILFFFKSKQLLKQNLKLHLKLSHKLGS